MRFRVAASLAALALLVIVVQTLVVFRLLDRKEEEFIARQLSQQIEHSNSGCLIFRQQLAGLDLGFAEADVGGVAILALLLGKVRQLILGSLGLRFGSGLRFLRCFCIRFGFCQAGFGFFIHEVLRL